VIRGISNHDVELYEELLNNTLMPPTGDNLIRLAKANREISKLIKEIIVGKLGCAGIAVMNVLTFGEPPS
jgi:hypothetical protein